MPLALAMVVGLAVAAHAKAETPNLREGTPVTLVGVVSSAPKGVIGEQKMQVAIGPDRTDYTLHFKDAEVYSANGKKIDEDGVDDGQWIRAEGWVMGDPRRIKVRRVEVLGKAHSTYRQSTFFRAGFEQGYLAASDRLPSPAAAAAFGAGTPVVIVGEVTSPPKGLLGEQKLQVAVGPAKTDYTLHFNGATLLGPNGQKLDEDGLDGGQWVRAEGQVMPDSSRRIKVTRLQVVAKDTPALQQSAFYRTGLEHGFITSVAGTRQTFPLAAGALRAAPMVLVGRVSDDTGTFEATRKIQVTAAGNQWTLHVPENAQVLDMKGEKISVHAIGEKQWIRAHGWRTDDLRMRVYRIENIGKDEALRTSAIYRSTSPLGYAENTAISSLERGTLNGTITEVNSNEGYIKVRGPGDTVAIVWLPAAEVSVRNRTTDMNDFQVGDEVEVTTFTFR